jgi:hypothetical protein
VNNLSGEIMATKSLSIFDQVVRLERAIETAVKRRVFRARRRREPERAADIPEYIFVILETAPIHKEKAPIHEDKAPIHEDKAPIHEDKAAPILKQKAPSLDGTSESTDPTVSVDYSKLPMQDDCTSVSIHEEKAAPILKQKAPSLNGTSESTDPTFSVDYSKLPMQDDCTSVSTDSTGSFVTVDLEYRTIDQNEFLKECIMNDNVSFFVHFFVENSPVTEAIDKQMEQIRGQSLCRCLRIDARLAPLMTAKLRISNETPTVVALKNGSMVNRISDCWSNDCEDLQKWAFTIELLFM